MKIASNREDAVGSGPSAGGRIIDGRYELVRRLGAGAGGSVYAARDLLAGVDVALKLVPHSAGDPGEEFLLARTLVHPNVVRVFDAGRAGQGESWFTMELLADADLLDVRARHGVEGVLRAAMGCALALDYVHGRGFIHGDIKPANVLTVAGPAGVDARVIDFGLATGDGLRGTPAYMAPELTRGGRPDAAADLYALGVTLYEALTGQNPFRAATVSETLDRQRALVPPALEDVPPLVAAVVARLLQKNADARYRDARALLHALTDAAPPAAASLASGGTPMPPGCGPFFGRDTELAALVKRLPPAGGGLVALGGGPGSGKTRLLDELAARARLRGLRVLRVDGAEPAPLATLARALYLSEGGRPRAADETPAARVAQVPTLLLIDGPERADATARAFLEQLVAKTRKAEHVLVVVASRAVQTALGPLKLEAFRSLLAATLGAPDPEGRLAGLLHRAADGRPGRLEAILAAQVAAGTIAWREGRWTVDPRLLRAEPAELAQAATAASGAEGAARLSARERALLEPAAVLGDGFAAAELAAFFAQDEAAVGAALAACAALQREDERWRFAEPGLREAVYAALAAERRGALHARAAEIVARHRPVDHEARARHLEGCGRTEAALEALEQAAAGAAAGGRPDRAARLFRQGASLATAPASWHERAGDAAMVAGAFDAAREDYGRAGRAPRVRRKLGWAFTEEGRFADGLPIVSEALAAALDAGETEEVLACRFATGWTAMMSGDYARAAEEARLGLEAAADRDLPFVARLWRLEGTIAWHKGDAERAIRAFERGIDVAGRTGDAAASADCQMGLGTALRIRGDLDGAVRAYEAASRDNERLARLVQVAKCQNGLGIVHYIAGRWDDAAAAWERFRDTCVRTGDRSDLVMGHNNLGFLFKDRGELERAEIELERGRAVAEAAGFTRGLAMVTGNLGEVLTRRGRPADARKRLEEACRLAAQIDSQDELLENRRRLVALAVVEGDAERALREADEVLALAREQNNKGEEGHLLQARGDALLALGRPDEAARALAEARALLGAHGGALDAARASLRLADAELRRDPDGPARLVADARAAGVKFGAADVLRDADRLAEALRARQQSTQGALDTVLAVARDLCQELHLDRLLSLIAERALDVTGADRGLVILYESNGEVRLGGARWRDGEDRDGLALRISRTIADRVHREGRAVVVTDVESESDLRQQASILAMQLRTIVCVPLAVRDQSLGLLYIDSRRPQQRFDGPELAILEALAAQAAVAVQNARLFEAERRRRDLVAMMANDFRTPLNALKQAVDMVVHTAVDLDFDLRRLLGTVAEQIGRLDRLSKDVVDLEHLDDGDVPIEPEDMDVGQFLMLATFYVDAMAREAGVELVVDEIAGVPEVRADGDRVSQILSNLVGTALRFVPAGGRVRLTADLLDFGGAGAPSAQDGLGWSLRPALDGPCARISVIAEGANVSAEQAARLLASRRVSDDAGNDTLGLAIARELVQRQGGEVWASDGRGLGTAFHFTLPLARGAA